MIPTSPPAAGVPSVTQQSTRRFTTACPPDPAHVGWMRRLAAEHLRLWDVAESATDNVVLAISELVTNSIRHGQGDVGLTVALSREGVRVEVTDDNPHPATITHAQPDDTSGCGLFLVAVLACDWGVSEDGTTTWCLIDTAARRPS